MCEILAKENLTSVTKLFRVGAPAVARKARAGQFVIIRTHERGERIPLTIADYDGEQGTITLVVQEVGKTTLHMGTMQTGDSLAGLTGPLGLPSEIECYGTVVCVGGGFAIAPLFPIARALKDAGNTVLSVIGARSADLLFWEERMQAVSDELIVCTDDGSCGRQALVTAPMQELLAAGRAIDRVWVIGPAVMMKFCAQTTRPFGVRTIVNLNPIMVDGTGMCGACRVEVGGQTRFACVDGPEFDGHQVDWDLLLARQRIYVDQEKQATERWEREQRGHHRGPEGQAALCRRAECGDAADSGPGAMESSSLDRFLGQPTAQIMLLGTFHFQDRGLDQHKPQFRFDVFSERRQREVAEVVASLAAYAPTKIAVERRAEEQQELDTSYAAYLRGTFALPADEVYQIGFRLARRLGHECVYGVNAWGRYYEPPIDIEAHVRAHGLDREVLNELLLPHTPEAYAGAHGQTHHLSQWSPRFAAAAAYEDRLKTELSLRDVLLRANAEAHILRGHGRYLVDEFKVGGDGEYRGVDWVTHWYNRNLRIFANLQRITESPDERILLIIGGGHVPILRHCVQASPEYELVEVEAFLR